MRQAACLLALVLGLAHPVVGWSQNKASESAKKPADGVYVVQRDSLKESDVLPLKKGEALLVHRHRYLKKDDKEPPRFVVVRSAPDVELDLAGEPTAVKEGTEVVRVLLKLQPKAATALERLTRDHVGGQITIAVGGEVVTMHKIREVIRGGDVQITSCAAGAADYLFQQLQARQKKD